METEVQREKKKNPTQFSTTLYIPLTLAKGENLIIYDASCYFFFSKTRYQEIHSLIPLTGTISYSFTSYTICVSKNSIILN